MVRLRAGLDTEPWLESSLLGWLEWAKHHFTRNPLKSRAGVTAETSTVIVTTDLYNLKQVLRPHL